MRSKPYCPRRPSTLEATQSGVGGGEQGAGSGERAGWHAFTPGTTSGWHAFTPGHPGGTQYSGSGSAGRHAGGTQGLGSIPNVSIRQPAEATTRATTASPEGTINRPSAGSRPAKVANADSSPPGCGSNRSGQAQYSGSLHVRGEDTRNSGEIRKPPPGPSFLCPPGRRPLRRGARAADYRRIAVGCHKNLSGHCCSGRLAVRSGDRQASFPFHQRRVIRHSSGSEYRVLRLEAVQDCRLEWRCYGSRTRHPGSRVGWHVPKTADACRGKRVVVADGNVRAAQPPAFVEQDTCQGPHAGTADAHHVGTSRLAGFKDRSCRSHSSLPKPSVYHIAAATFVANGRWKGVLTVTRPGCYYLISGGSML